MKDQKQRELELAQARITRSRGVYNVNPWLYLFGILLAMLATLFSAYAVTRKTGLGEPSAPSPPSPASSVAPAPTERLIWVQ